MTYNLKDESTKQLVLKFKEQNVSNREIGRKLGIPESTIRAFVNKQTHRNWWEGLNQKLIANYPIDVSNINVGVCLNQKNRFSDSILDKLKSVEKVKYTNKGPTLLNKAIQEAFEYVKPKEDNSIILLISDLHIPYNHPDSLEFLQYLKDKYQPTRVICLGDEVDHLALSYHEKETEAPSAIDELKLALPVIKKLETMFPVMDILDSNHGSLAYRKAKTAGIPKHYLKSYADVLQVGEGWQWHFDMVIDLPTGNKCYLHHGKSANITKTSQAMSMCAVAGHFHNTFKVEYWANPIGLYWGMQCGCLIDDKSYAFNYNNANLHRPLIGTGLIINGLPVLEAMVLNEDGRWVGKGL